jgi:hypothetical protein
MEILNQYETTLRDIIVIALQNHFKEKWEDHYSVTEERINTWKDNQIRETAKRRGVNTENRLIYYSEIYDLRTIIIKNWDHIFSDVFVDRKKFEVFHSIVEDCRNSISHSRDVPNYQKKMIESIVDDFRTKIVLYNTKFNQPENFFITILKAADNYGNNYDHTRKREWFWKDDKLTLLRVGELIEFSISAFDPQDRELHYSVISNYKMVLEKQKQNNLRIKVTNEMIAQKSTFTIIVEPAAGYEEKQFVSFDYCIVPAR